MKNIPGVDTRVGIRSTTAKGTLVGALGLLSASTGVWAGEFNNRLLATGERAAGMGGAFVALADDDSGMLYNPAGLVHSNSDAPSATVNVVSASSTRYDDVFGALSWKRDSLGIVPSFFGVTTTTSGGWIVGASVVVLDYFSEDQTDQFRDVAVGQTTYDELRVHNDSTGQTYNSGITLAREWADSGWSIGLTTYFHYSERNRSFSQRLSQDSEPSTVQDDSTIQIQVNLDDETIGIRPILGAQFRNDRFSLGLSASQLLPIKRDYFYAFTGTATTPSESLAFDLVDDSDKHERQPLLLSLGTALFVSNTTLVSIQVDHATSRNINVNSVPAGLPPRDVDMTAVTNLSAGIETALSSRWVLRGGVYTDKANNEVDEAVLFERREEIDVYGLAFSVSKRRERGYWTLGFDVARGNGKASLGDVGFGTDSLQRVDASKSAFNLLISTTW